MARDELGRVLGGPRLEVPDAPWLRRPGATFVTLLRRGELRGCVGSLEAKRPLADDVRHSARSAALSDPRFPPVDRGELPDITVEVSLLSPPEPVPVTGEDDAAAKLRPGRDGVILEHDGRSATFLPQVWEQLPDPREFLARLKEKAGLGRTAWSDDFRLSRYEVEKWSEKEADSS